MDLTYLSGGALGLGLAALALGLFAAQRLRLRHDEVLVPTTLFWRAALEETRARTLVERFRHPLAYALVLAVAGLLWLAVARPDAVRERGPRHVFLLDGSAGMAVPGRFEAAVTALERALAAAPRDRTEVLWCGADVHTLLAPGEDRALLRARLADRAPEAAPASVERALGERSLAPWLSEAGGAAAFTRCVVFGDAPLRAVAAPGLHVERADLGVPPAPALAVTALGVAPAASGDWTRVDVLATVRGPGAAAADGTPALTVRRADGALLDGALARSELAPDHAEHVFLDVPADGATLTFQLDRPGAPALALWLPERRRLRVGVDPGLSAAVGAEAAAALIAALDADVAVERTPEPPHDLWVGDGGVGLPRLTFAPLAQQEEAIVVRHAPLQDSAAALAEALGELGLDRLDAAALAETLGRPIALGAAPGPEREVALWRELVAAPAFLEDRGFPLLLGRAVRWLAAAPDVAPYAAVARPAPRRVGRPAPPGSARAVTLASPGAAPQLEFDWRLAAATAPGLLATPADGPTDGPGGWRPFTWILALALAGLVAEWALVQRGRVP